MKKYMNYIGVPTDSSNISAIKAEKRGKFTASVIAKKLGKGCTAKGVKAVLKPYIWENNTPYNDQDYFNLEEAENRIEEIQESSKKRYRSTLILPSNFNYTENENPIYNKTGELIQLTIYGYTFDKDYFDLSSDNKFICHTERITKFDLKRFKRNYPKIIIIHK